jgi:hypothetical protein
MSHDIIDVYDRSIFEMRNVFTAEECKLFIDYHEQSPNKFCGRLQSGEENVVKRSTDVQITGACKHDLDLIKIYKDGLGKVFVEYMKHLNDINKCGYLSSLIIGNVTAPQIQRTSKGDFFHLHADTLKVMKRGGRGYEERMLAIIIYLNDIDEENGGSTEFNSGRKVQPETGKVLFFPTDLMYIHRGNTILNGDSKYILSAFLMTTTSENDDFPFVFA